MHDKLAHAKAPKKALLIFCAPAFEISGFINADSDEDVGNIPTYSLISVATISRVHKANANLSCNGFFSGCDRPDRLRTLLAHEPGLANASDEDGGTPLHHLHGALTHGTEMIDLLVVQHHADVNASDRRGVTVLANVKASGAADLADPLRTLGAN